MTKFVELRGEVLLARHAHGAHHEGGDVVPHALLFRTCGLKLGRPACGRGALGGGAMGLLPLTLVLVSVLVVAHVVPALIPLLGVVTVLRGRALRRRRRIVA